MKVDNARAYIRLYEELSLERIDELESFVDESVRFKDPFNDIVGRTKLRKLLKRVLSSVSNPVFRVTSQSWDGDVLYLRWSFNGHIKELGNWSVEGMSEVIFNEQGMVIEHIDYWDSGEQFYEKIPIISGLLRMIKNRLKVL